MGNNIKKFFGKDPNAVKDYIFDWSKWLSPGEEIVSYELFPTDGLVVDSSDLAANSTKVIVWLSAGTPPVATCTNRIVTSGGRTEDFTFGFDIQEN